MTGKAEGTRLPPVACEFEKEAEIMVWNFAKTASVAGLALLTATTAAAESWIAAPEVIAARPGETVSVIRGIVFEDGNGDGKHQAGEQGVEGVMVSNGLDVVTTGQGGEYSLPVRADMNLTIVQPSGWKVPTDARQVPQFFHVHKSGGSPTPLRFGGLPAMGPAPQAVNFPLQRSPVSEDFSCAIIGDSQTYSNTEISHFRDSTIADLLRDGAGTYDCLLYVGDVVGDDLSLLDRILEVGAVVGAPQFLVHGNHDYDFDATSDADSSDSWRRIYGPEYFAFEFGKTTFIVLDNVVYPCGPQDAAMPGREFCGEGQPPAYNGRVPDTQMTWLTNVLANVPKDRLIVVAHHIPFISFVDSISTKHQTDNLAAIHALLEGRPALSLSGHTHTFENHAEGQVFAGWQEAVAVGKLPFRHIIAGAASGGWYQGDLDVDGIPMALQRMGAPKGYLRIDFDGSDYRETYYGARIDPERQQWLGFNTPEFRRWFDAITTWADEDRATRNPLPPLSINDLADTRLFTPADLAEGVWLTANVWAGDAATSVTAAINGGPAMVLERTQSGTGEAPLVGAEWADPFAAMRQLSVGRVAMESQSGNTRAQGVEVFRGTRFGPAAPQPMSVLADRNAHLWRVRLPEGLPHGTHVVTLTTTDRHGRVATESMAFEVREQRPAPRWQSELWPTTD